MHSAIYRGRVGHTRIKPKAHSFAYQMQLMFVDVDELEDVQRLTWLCSSAWYSPMRYRRKDFHGDVNLSIKQAIYQTVFAQKAIELNGPVKVLSHWRCFGFNFNPLTTYYCYDASGERVVAIVAEVTNTPWLERHAYVLDVNADQSANTSFAKAFTVSPFNPVNMQYQWRSDAPSASLSIAIDNFFDGERIFSASLNLKREALSAEVIRKHVLLFPLAPLRAVLNIYWQAAVLWWKGIPFLGKNKTLSKY